MIEHVIVESIRGQDIPAIVRLVDGPVVPQPLRTKDQHTVVAQLMILDDGQSLERLAQSDAVGEDAAAKSVQLVDGSHGAVALELVELLPYDGVADAGRTLDHGFFI